MSRIYEERIVKEEVLVGGICDLCGHKMGVVGPGNIDGGAELTLDGWYGGAIDPWPETPTVLLCSFCTAKAIKQFFPHDTSLIWKESDEST